MVEEYKFKNRRLKPRREDDELTPWQEVFWVALVIGFCCGMLAAYFFWSK